MARVARSDLEPGQPVRLSTRRRRWAGREGRFLWWVDKEAGGHGKIRRYAVVALDATAKGPARQVTVVPVDVEPQHG